MNYQVPQFIEVEDKIFGPLTLKQFVYLAGGAGISFVLYRIIPISFLAIILIIILMAFALALAFYKVNNKPFIEVVEAAFKYVLNHKLYLWKKGEVKPNPNQSTVDQIKKANELSQISVPKLSESKLKDLAWSLDINESIYSNDKQK